MVNARRLMLGAATVNNARIYLITDYGAIAGSNIDVGPIINNLVNSLPPEGGSIVIPYGEFVVKTPIVITRSFMTLQGLNHGLRSNIDTAVSGLAHPGGGSKLLIDAGVSQAIIVPSQSGNRTSGLLFRDFLIAGAGTGGGQTGIRINNDNDGVHLENITAINLDTAAYISGADAGRVSGCWFAEVRNSLVLAGSGQQNIIESNHFGAQPQGITCRLENQRWMVFSGNTVFPDGHTNISAPGASSCTFSGNMLSTYYTGAVDISGNNNTFSGNTIETLLSGGNWVNDPIGRDGFWGLIRISGDDNLMTANSILSLQPTNHTRVHCPSGARNVFSNLLISGNGSTGKVLINGSATNDIRVIYCARADEIDSGGGNAQIVAYS